MKSKLTGSSQGGPIFLMLYRCTDLEILTRVCKDSLMATPPKEMIPVRLPPETVTMIDQLIPIGLYGSNRGEIARQLILDQLKRLVVERVIKLPDR